MIERLIDWLLFSSLLVAAAAGCLAAAVAMSLAGRVPVAVPALAFSGTLAIYGLDRLRDRVRDRATSPLRTDFVVAHRRTLEALVVAAFVACLPFAMLLGPAAIVLLAPALVLGLLHRRLKGVPAVKLLYITGAWLLVGVALPALVTGARAGLGWATAIVAGALLANAIAANVRDNEAGAARFGRRPALHGARACAVLGVVAGLAAPAALRPLLAIPLATGLVLIPFRPGERYGLGVVDGALLVGAAVALVAA